MEKVKRRRYAPVVCTTEAPPAGIKDEPAAVDVAGKAAASPPPVKRRASVAVPGPDNPNATHFLTPRSDVSKQDDKLPQDAFEKMKELNQFFCDQIDSGAETTKMSDFRKWQLKSQAKRAARSGALIDSAYARMQTDPRFLKRMQEVSAMTVLNDNDAKVQRFEEKLAELMGESEIHEAKVAGMKSKSKPTALTLVMPAGYSKSQMAETGDDDKPVAEAGDDA